jgi:hypothetical protein
MNRWSGASIAAEMVIEELGTAQKVDREIAGRNSLANGDRSATIAKAMDKVGRTVLLGSKDGDRAEVVSMDSGPGCPGPFRHQRREDDRSRKSLHPHPW